MSAIDYPGLIVAVCMLGYGIYLGSRLAARAEPPPAPPPCRHGGTTTQTVLLCDCGTSFRVLAGDQWYELGHTVNMLPVIRNIQTGKSWCIPWQELLRLAQGCGIDRPVEQEGGTPCPSK